MLGDSTWPPSFEMLDFLKIMDSHYPDLARQRIPKRKMEEEMDEKVMEDVVVKEEAPGPAGKPDIHTEL